MKDISVGFIGAGNMAAALIQGLHAHGLAGSQIHACDRNPEKLARLAADCGIQRHGQAQSLVAAVDVLVIAVKPQGLAKVLEEVHAVLASHRPLLISVAAGITLKSLQAWSPAGLPIVRCMPNTPSLVGCGASGLLASKTVTEGQRSLAQALMEAVGTVTWVADDGQMDALTALSGSGPAYFFLLMEAMVDAAVDLGLPREDAQQLCQQTALGAARLAEASQEDVAQLRRKVTSPGGTTEAAIRQFESEAFRAIVARALGRATERSAQLGRELGRQED